MALGLLNSNTGSSETMDKCLRDLRKNIFQPKILYMITLLRMRVEWHFQTHSASKSLPYLPLFSPGIWNMNTIKINWKIKFIHTHTYIKKEDLKFREQGEEKKVKDPRITDIYQRERETCPDWSRWEGPRKAFFKTGRITSISECLEKGFEQLVESLGWINDKQ